MKEIELLSPARNSEIGMAAIDCGADSVYIAAPKYGARHQAGNSFEDISNLCSYAHRFNAKVYLTLNTILYDDELKEAQEYLQRAYESGVDAVIVQDLGLLKMEKLPLPLFASTQTDIRTPEKAALLEELGFKRLILARELSLRQISEIRKATTVPLESFVHGALCVCYSGQCYLSQYLTGRSANRGECAQVCRSEFDLIDQDGNVLAKDSHLLSLKDMNRSDKIENLIDAGITSFKIEGRLKNISYVKNIVRLYDTALQDVIERKRKSGEEITRSSYGKSKASFIPDANKTFNRGYTDYFLDGKKDDFRSADSAKGMGEYLGKVTSISGGGRSFVSFTYSSDKTINNSDGLCFTGGGKISSGNRASRVDGKTVELFTKSADFRVGDSIYRNYDAEFEKSMLHIPSRLIEVKLRVTSKEKFIAIKGRVTDIPFDLRFDIDGEIALNQDSAKELIKRQLGKSALQFGFTVESVEGGDVFFYKTSALNSVRNSLAQEVNNLISKHIRQQKERALNVPDLKSEDKTTRAEKLREFALSAFKDGGGSYLRNCSNRLSKSLYRELGLEDIRPSYEQQPPKNASLMTCRYCIRFQLGLCPDESKRLFLKNGKNTLALEFDCKNCEMKIKSQ